METELTVDAALRAEFIDESLDMLSGLEPLFVKLESDPGDLETVQAIFRPIHSIKGNASFFDFPGVKTLAHEMETILDRVRQKLLAVSAELIGAELEGVDLLKQILERGRNGQPEIADQQVFQALVERVKRIATQEITAASLAGKIRGALRDVRLAVAAGDDAALAMIDAIISELRLPEEKGPAPKSAAGGGAMPSEWVRLMEILATPIESTMDDTLAREAGNCLTQLRSAAATDADRVALDSLIDNYRTFMDTLGFDALIQELLKEGLAAIAFSAPAAPALAPNPAPEAPAARPRDDHGKTMRVSEQHVDTFLSYVGELLVVRDMFNHLETRLGAYGGAQALRTDFRRINETFAVLSGELQRSIMSIRLVAVGAILQRVPRLVRDIASAAGKEIEVTLSGEKIEVDKSLVDLLDAPLTHMVRNAADHGIEMPEVRRAAGKRPSGAITVRVTELPNNLSMVIEDDGGGLDLDRIHKKAVEMGIVAEGQRLTEDDIVSFLFQSGVSTAEAVTDISGRGVGMDVVKRMVEEAGGAIHVSSQRGKGTRFEVVAPKSVTTQIVSGFLVEAGGQRFVFPMTKVLETTRLNRAHVLTVAGRGECFKHHDNVIALASMEHLLDLPRTSDTARDFELVVVLATRQGGFGVAVDRVVGVQQVVLRRIDGLMCRSESIAGGALMGDGSVALIIDVDRLRGEYTASTMA